MLRENFFFKLFKYKQKSSDEIMKYSSNKKFALQDQLNIKIKEIDQTISENSKDLIQAQVIKLRSNLSRPNNFIEKIGRNAYKTKLEESISWHQRQIKELYLRRRELQINLEKIKGVFWLNRIKRFIQIIVLGFLIFFSLFIFLSGFMIIIYLLPLIILILLGYLLFTRR